MYGRSWVRFPSGTQIISLSHARDMLNIPSFLISSPSLKFTIFLYYHCYIIIIAIIIIIIIIIISHLLRPFIKLLSDVSGIHSIKKMATLNENYLKKVNTMLKMRNKEVESSRSTIEYHVVFNTAIARFFSFNKMYRETNCKSMSAVK